MGGCEAERGGARTGWEEGRGRAPGEAWGGCLGRYGGGPGQRGQPEGWGGARGEAVGALGERSGRVTWTSPQLFPGR